MPPQRTFPAVKPLKTERTHEENQERAYIAASRRSDRSLEARVESARRASEIHKRRTGRSLRVTEQDVINEEMYEEEDDDIPSQYRRLTAHLQTGSAEFNRRLQTYLTNHIAMRTALNDAIHNNFSQHYPNAPQFAHNSSMYPSPLMTQSFPPAEPVRTPPAVSPHSAHGYRVAPYSVSARPGYRSSSQLSPARANSLSTQSQNLSPGSHRSSVDTATAASRRMSLPVSKVEQPEFQLPAKPPSIPSDEVDTVEENIEFASPIPEDVQGLTGDASITTKTQQKPRLANVPDLTQGDPFGPLSMALPMESQQLVNRETLPQNDFGVALMAGSDIWMQGASGLGASNPGEMIKPDSNFYPSTSGMNSTLLPEYGPADSTNLMVDKFDTSAMGPGQGLDFGQFLDFGGSSGSNVPSGAGTPASDHQVWKDLVDSTWPDGAGVV